MTAPKWNSKLALAVAAAALVAVATGATTQEPAPVDPSAGGPIGQGFLGVATPGWTSTGRRSPLPGTSVTVPIPAGPAGQPDFWNYDPFTGAKSSDHSPGVAPDELARMWSGSR